MKYCIHCGKEVLDDAIICPGCGCSVQYGNGSSQQNGFNKAGYNRQGAPSDFDAYSPVCILGFVFAFFSPLIGLILSIVAHSEAQRTGSLKSRSLSKAGIIISAVFLAVVAVWICIFIITLWIPAFILL
ncbi:MAG: hypothetical protein K2O81_01980 [Clostridia bacterium]|nr:hypothetical protein [Clostridia bacterium]